jgi:hypothetical protein
MLVLLTGYQCLRKLLRLMFMCGCITFASLCCVCSYFLAFMWQPCIRFDFLQFRKPSNLPELFYSQPCTHLPCIRWHLKMDQGFVGKKTVTHLTLRCRLKKGEHNWAEGSGWQRFLIFKLSQESIPSRASWHSSCYFSPGFFLLTSELY